jgi:hypothetical protein
MYLSHRLAAGIVPGMLLKPHIAAESPESAMRRLLSADMIYGADPALTGWG